ncbi:GatB/YqeY domain-containing protein [Phreatobacter sp. AB_2022a]|uniref:GatB/YqeY domain-containing protein n=1 Tax=Phreatobacter sp. AB_2022a TaxID=3003134 RepID=UPI002286EEDF|nr:GatB/YqeY domain-containing protein [Phreatobacter sp. AB_2022a]MCZ0734170.1 GatB/YqeY domain-containing protein [Phreatobacter sp. AB_2022a]
MTADIGTSDAPDDAARDVKAALRADLRSAMKCRKTIEAKVIRGLIAAIDNAEAPPNRAVSATYEPHRFEAGSAEVQRLRLSRADVRAVLASELREREGAANELERLGRSDEAEALRAEARLVQCYLE